VCLSHQLQRLIVQAVLFLIMDCLALVPLAIRKLQWDHVVVDSIMEIRQLIHGSILCTQQLVVNFSLIVLVLQLVGVALVVVLAMRLLPQVIAPQEEPVLPKQHLLL